MITQTKMKLLIPLMCIACVGMVHMISNLFLSAAIKYEWFSYDFSKVYKMSRDINGITFVALVAILLGFHIYEYFVNRKEKK